jgi:hypothetical protein
MTDPSPLLHLEEDLQRFRGLHSWYKFGKDEDISVWVLLMFGQQPYQPIFPNTNSAYATQLRWWFVTDLETNHYTKWFGDDTSAIVEASNACVSNIKLNKLGSSRDDKIMSQLAINAHKFYFATREIYEKLSDL